MNWLALDIGGANLKAADGQGFAAEQPFPLWQAPTQLHRAVADLFSVAPASSAVAVTMTGELADCYATKREGVRQILQQVEQAAGDRMLRVYRTAGDFVTAADAVRDPHSVAASNWHALATWAIRQLPARDGLLIDIGSTTTDIIPISAENVCAVGSTDVDRLTSGELVYTGIRRTGVATLVSFLPYRGRMCGVARETFATTGDVYLTLQKLTEDPTDCDTADGRPATRSAARNRLARMLCMDEEQITFEDSHTIAVAVMESQLKLLQSALEQVLNRQQRKLPTALVSGSGEFLARVLLEKAAPEMQVFSLSEQGNLPISQCAPAHAVAVLARERCR